MDPTHGSTRIKQIAREAGFDLCGIAPAQPHSRGDFVQRWLADGFSGTMTYLHRHLESRIDVRSWLPWARSVIVVALNYRQPQPTVDQAPRGRVAVYAWGEDYHRVVRDKLERVVQRVREEFGEAFQSRICVDTSAVIERELAAAAGIGWIGKNTLVLSPTLGSFFVLGEIITDLELAPDSPQTDHCGTCTRCLDACPTAAFPGPYVMDARRCISYLTIEHRGEIDPPLADRMGDWVFGCDVCQTVCPFNQRSPDTTEPRFAPGDHRTGKTELPTDGDVAFPKLEAIEAWDEEAYRFHTARSAQRRAKLHMWKRNAAIARRNREGSSADPPAAAQSTNSTPTR